MIQTPDQREAMVDLVSELVSAMRLSGGVILDAEFRSPWCVSSYLLREDCAHLLPGTDQIIAYHYVRSGEMWARLGDEPPTRLKAGEIVLFPRNDPHQLYSEDGVEIVDAHTLIQRGEDSPLARISWGGAGDCCTIFCGFLGAERPDRTLIDSLPPMLKVSIAEGAWADWMESSLRLAATELAAGSAAVGRIAELLFAESIRRYLESVPQCDRGWLAGLQDPAVNRALSIIHGHYDEPLDMESLARQVGLSRSALNARFTTLVGEPPIRYWTRRRLRAAASLLRDGRATAAEAGYQVGFGSEAAFSRAFKREYGVPPSAWRRLQEAAATPEARSKPLRQQIRFCRAPDGVELAYSCVGDGPPLVKPANWLNHLEFEWESPIWRHWLKELTRETMLVRYDERGNGLSDWKVEKLSFEAFVSDLETVVDAAGVDRFDMFGISQGASVGIAYAVRHPERVKRLILVGGYAAGWAARRDPEETARREAMIALTKIGWGQDNPAFRQMFTTLYFPGATPEQADWFNELQRVSASPEGAQRLQRVLSEIDVRHLLAQVTVPTLIFHSVEDSVVPFAAGKTMAEGIAGARFIPLESANHILLEHEPAWPRFVAEMRKFLAEPV